MIDTTEAIKLIKEPKAGDVISSARLVTKNQRKHLTGEGYKEWLEQRIKSLESDRAKEIKEMLAKPVTRGIFKQIIGVYQKIFRADGTIRNYSFRNQGTDKEKELKEILKTAASGESLKTYMKNSWFKYLAIDFMGVEMVEVLPLTEDAPSTSVDVQARVKVCHYSIEDIHDIHVEGGEVKYIIFRWIEKHDQQDIEVFRVYDKSFDTLYIRRDGEVYLYPEVWAQEKGIKVKIENPFGQVPAIQTSQRSITMDETEKRSWLDEAMENADLYLSISDDHTACVKLYQHPIMYSYPLKCKVCDGEGKLYHEDYEDGYNVCNTCVGSGVISQFRSDVTKGITVPMNTNSQGALDSLTVPDVPAPVGFITIDHESLGEQRVEMDFELDFIERAALGMTGLLERKDKQETELSKLSDYQPVLDVLNMISWNGEKVEGFLTDMIGRLYFPKEYTGSDVVYGRKYHVKTVDVITEEIKNAKEAGSNESFLMELQTELYQTRFENNKRALDRALLLLKIEPYPTRSTEEVKALGLADARTLQFKLNFIDLVEDFEQMHGDITLYKAESNKRRTDIEDEMYRIMDEKYSNKDKTLELLRSFPDLVQNKLIESIPEDQRVKILNITQNGTPSKN